MIYHSFFSKGGRMKPIIGIIGRVDIDEDQYQMFCSYEKLRRAIQIVGGIPILLLPTQLVDYYHVSNHEIQELTKDEKDDLLRELELCDGIVIPGGNRWFVNFDAFLANEAIKRKMPVLGICAGMQVLAILETGGQIIEKVKGKDPHFSKEKYVHSVRIVPHTHLSQLLGVPTIHVNSRHHYVVHHINEEKYRVNAYSIDGYIEGIERKEDSYVMGVQWHPESMVSFDPYAKKILEDFVSETKKYKILKKNP